MKIVLLVSPDEHILRLLEKQLRKKGLGALKALDISTAEELFFLNIKKVSAVLLDDGHPAQGIVNKEFARKVKLISSAPIVAMATFGDVREAQMRYGCTHQCDKAGAAQLVATLIEQAA